MNAEKSNSDDNIEQFSVSLPLPIIIYRFFFFNEDKIYKWVKISFFFFW